MSETRPYKTSPHLLAQVIDKGSSLLEGLVVGVYAESKLGIAVCVLMSTEDFCRWRQGLQL